MNDAGPPAILVLGDLRHEQAGPDAVASMSVTGGSGPAERLILRRHAAGTADIEETATPFLPIGLVLAAVQGLDLRIDGPVDPVAADGAGVAAGLLAGWFGWTAPRIAVGDAAPATEPATATGLFFSRGLDSMTTLIQRRADIGVLLGMDWHDAPLATEGTAEIWRGTQAAADDAGLPLLRLTTNARRFLDPVVPWELSHGAVLGALAQLASPSIGTAIISGTHPEGREAPYGSHPQLDPCWSSSRVRVVYAAGGGGRNEKAAVVATDPFAVRWLKVCWERPGDGNCGRCAKCLMTLTNFHIAGRLEAVRDRFDAPLTPEAVSAVADRAILSPENVEALIEALDPADPLLEPWTRVLRRAIEHDPTGRR